jgi:predicted GH43/DUF377 family glycosyl hydrolase
MRWRKLGLVFAPSGERPWMRTHAAVPVPLGLGGSLYRIYFTCRDEHNRSHVGFLNVDLAEPTKVLEVAREPALAPGPLGYFDDHGVYGNSLVEHEGRLLLYYIGWNPGPREPLFYASIGLAASDDGGETFERVSAAPVLARSDFDPCFVTSPFVRIENGAWRMWYTSGFRWDTEDGVLRSNYNIKHAESANGVEWTRDGVACIDNRPGERNIVRPCVLGRYEMWYAFDAGAGYRIGFATSEDGYAWTRRDEEAGIDVSEEGWDSQAIAYPYVFEHDGARYLLYSGNGFGRDGFGIAVAEAA